MSRSGNPPSRALRALWPVSCWLIVAVLALAPLLSDGAARPPFGRPWYLGRLLIGLGVLGLGSLAARWRVTTVGDDSGSRSIALALLFLFSYALIVSNYVTLASGDMRPSVLVPAALLAGDGFDLSRSAAREGESGYWLLPREGASLSAFPLGTGILAVPYFAVALATGSELAELTTEDRFEKHAAAIFCAAAVACFGLALLPAFGIARSVGLGAALAACTQLLPNLSQGLWSATGELLCLAIAAALLAAKPADERRAFASGLAAGMAFFCRPTALLLLPLAAAHFRSRARPARYFAAGLLSIVAASCALNLRLYGHPLGGYGLLNATTAAWTPSNLPSALAGVLLSPSRGLVVFFPVVVVAALLGPPADLGRRRLWWAALAAVALVVGLTATYSNWWGGYSIGPRLLAEISMPSIVLAALALGRARFRGARSLLIGCLVWQSALGLLFAHASGAAAWNGTVAVGHDPESLWSVRNGQIAASFPGWTYREPARYIAEPGAGWSGDASALSIDLEPVANDRYDRPLPSGESATTGLYLPRLAQEAAAVSPDRPLRPLASDRANVLRVCTGEVSPLIDVRARSVRRIVTILVWRSYSQGSPPAAGETGELQIVMKGGGIYRRPLLEGREVYDLSKEARRLNLPALDRLYAGTIASRDALVTQEFGVAEGRRQVRGLRLAGPTAVNPGCLYLLAAAAQLDR